MKSCGHRRLSNLDSQREFPPDAGLNRKRGHMDIKIVCGCGQKYIFEVDPDNGLMPASVNLSRLWRGRDQEANEILAQIFPTLSNAGDGNGSASSRGCGGRSHSSQSARSPGHGGQLPPPLPQAARPASRPVNGRRRANEGGRGIQSGPGILGRWWPALGAGLMYGFFAGRLPVSAHGHGHRRAGRPGRAHAGKGTDTTLGVIAAALPCCQRRDALSHVWRLGDVVYISWRSAPVSLHGRPGNLPAKSTHLPVRPGSLPLVSTV